MGLGDFMSGIKDAAVNVGKGAVWAADPTHWDDIAEGVGKAGEFVIEHPGQVAHIAGEVGKGILKDQLDPVNLAINAGLLAATVATGGAAAPAFIAKLGLGAKSIEAGITAGKAVETGAEVVKGVQAGVKALDTATDVAKAVDTAGDVVKGVQTGTKALETATEGARALEAGADVAQTASKGGKVMQVVDKALGTGTPGKFGNAVSKGLNPLENSKLGMSAFRERAAGRILEAGGEAPSIARQATAALVQGSGHGAGAVTQLPGMGDKVYEAQRWAQRAGAVGKRLDQAGTVSEGVNIAADPTGFAREKAYEEADRQGIGRDSGYVDRGQTAESLYANTSQTAGPSSSSSVGGFSSPSQLAIGSGSQVRTGQARSPFSQGAAASGGGGAPPSSTASTAMPGQSPKPKRMAGWSQPGTVERPGAMKGGFGGRGQHFWEGPRSQWAGGVSSNYDWRPVDPLRKISAPGTIQSGRYKESVKERGAKPATEGASDAASSTMSTATPTAPGTAVDRYTGDLNEQGAPANFSPEVPKSGMYAMSQGQAPAGTAFPVARMGEGGRTRHHTATTLSQPIGAIGPGTSRTGNAVIDADSSSPDDFKFDAAGQGYFDFGNMGSGSTDVGKQPNAGSPMYQSGSRTSRRGAGTLGV